MGYASSSGASRNTEKIRLLGGVLGPGQGHRVAVAVEQPQAHALAELAGRQQRLFVAVVQHTPRAWASPWATSVATWAESAATADPAAMRTSSTSCVDLGNLTPFTGTHRPT